MTVSTWLFGELSPIEGGLWTIPSGLIQFGIALAILRYDRVDHRALGLAPRLVRPALAATAVVVLVANVAVAGLGMAAGTPISVGLMEYYLTAPFDYSVTGVAIAAVAMYVFTGPVEELAFRGYLQNKVVSQVTVGSPTTQTIIGILSAAVCFALLHIPAYLIIREQNIGAILGTLVLLAATGILFGGMYAATRNLYLVMFLHGIGNLWPLVIDPGTALWPNWGVILVLYLFLAVCYRWWAADLTLPIPKLQVTN
ncbi:CPBP family intramembrane glutamic endopeptidase [Halobellus limi]|nr:CPBP family intramembrane glutamic endopeptidase [Halobellus limi]